jgi:dephospho-CoA kinase
MSFKYAIALTGGIGTGKSTASALFSLNGFKVIDADRIAHSIIKNNSLAIANMFGQEYVIDGMVNRKSLGKLIFADQESRKKLEAFIHPKIFSAVETESQKLENLRFPYLIDIPLFFERHEAYPIDKTVLIYAPRETQIKRVIERDQLNQDEVIQRINSQLPIDEKLNLSTWIIKNSSSLKFLQSEVERVSIKIRETFIN